MNLPTAYLIHAATREAIETTLSEVDELLQLLGRVACYELGDSKHSGVIPLIDILRERLDGAYQQIQPARLKPHTQDKEVRHA